MRDLVNVAALVFIVLLFSWSEKQRSRENYDRGAPAMTQVSAINLYERLAILDDDQVVKLISMFDIDGEETDDPEEAITAVAELPGDYWEVVDLEEFERVRAS